jgi:hypothetical protein
MEGKIRYSIRVIIFTEHWQRSKMDSTLQSKCTAAELIQNPCQPCQVVLRKPVSKVPFCSKHKLSSIGHQTGQMFRIPDALGTRLCSKMHLVPRVSSVPHINTRRLKYSMTFYRFLYIIDQSCLLFKPQRFGDGILSPSSGRNYFS